MKSPYTGLTRIFQAFGYSYDGIKATLQTESAFRQDVLFCALAGATLFWLPVQGIALALMIFSLLFILIMELVNTGLEVVIDRIGSDFHPLSKKAKDIGSALVLLAFLNWGAIWGAILYQVWLVGR